MMAWLKGGRQGVLPDGAAIVKEQYPPPAARYEGLSDDDLRKRLTSWTVMIKDSRGSKDGWFWADYAPEARAGARAAANSFRTAMISHSLIQVQDLVSIAFVAMRPRSASTTFCPRSKNVEGFPGEPLTFPRGRVLDETAASPSRQARASSSSATVWAGRARRRGAAAESARRSTRAPEFLALLHADQPGPLRLMWCRSSMSRMTG